MSALSETAQNTALMVSGVTGRIFVVRAGLYQFGEIIEEE
jgi:hypothetical protein